MAGTRSRALRAASALLVGALAFGISACAANDDLADQYREGSNQGFISAGFEVVEIPADERGEAVDFAGVTENGDELTSADFTGDVMVVNFWYAACGPCIAEAPLLEQVWGEYEGQDVAFLGLNIYDQPDQAISFAKDNGVTYPSLITINDGSAKLAFASVTPIQATPTTLVLDKQGRVAARIIGQLESASILSSLVRDALAEEL